MSLYVRRLRRWNIEHGFAITYASWAGLAFCVYLLVK